MKPQVRGVTSWALRNITGNTDQICPKTNSGRKATTQKARKRRSRSTLP